MYGRISCSRICFQMIRVISSPSSSTTGFSTLIFAMLPPLPSRHTVANSTTVLQRPRATIHARAPAGHGRPGLRETPWSVSRACWLTAPVPADFQPGLRLAAAFHADVVRPLLAAAHPGLSYAAALIGPGSEVAGR